MATNYTVFLRDYQKDDKCSAVVLQLNGQMAWAAHSKTIKFIWAVRARCASEQSATNHFKERDHILAKYNWKDKPQLIYNVDEKDINTEYKPPHVVAGRGYQPQAVMTERSKTVSVSGMVNAQGKSDTTFLCFSWKVNGARLDEGENCWCWWNPDIDGMVKFPRF